MCETFTYHAVKSGPNVVAFEVRASRRVGNQLHHGVKVVERIECAPSDAARKAARKAAERVAKRMTKDAKRADKSERAMNQEFVECWR
jgi:hypothetical protein